MICLIGREIGLLKPCQVIHVANHKRSILAIKGFVSCYVNEAGRGLVLLVYSSKKKEVVSCDESWAHT